MSRSPAIPVDRRLLETDLAPWAGAKIARVGRKDALLGRVEMLRVSTDGSSIACRVRGKRPLPYHVEVRVDDDALRSDCTCAAEPAVACRHAVAAVEALRFPKSPRASNGKPRGSGRVAPGRGRIIQHATQAGGFLVVGGPRHSLDRTERMTVAREEELAARRHRASRERARVEALPVNGAAAAFDVEGRGPAYRVVLRGPKGDRGSCTCRDFSENELQTCKHIERARRWARHHKVAFPRSLLSLWWRPRRWTDRVPDPLAEIRIDLPIQEMPRSLRRYFESRGWLKPAPEALAPTDWARRAVEAARRVARRRGWGWDLDPAVGSRIKEAGERAARRTKLAGIAFQDEAWHRSVARLSFRLHHYQELGALFLARRGRAFLADDMGLGKTVQAIVAARLLRHVDGARKVLVVCPASLKHQWQGEIENACGEQVQVVDSPRRQRLETYARWREGFVVLNYELVLRDLEAIRASAPDLVILDEAQRIKNWNTKTAQAVKRLSSRHAFILTGTPLENRLLELHSLVEFLHPKALGPRWRLLPSHAVTEGQGRVVAYEGLDILRGRMKGFFLRRDRREVLDQLPERTDNTFWTGMTRAQRLPYRKYAATAAALLSRKQPLAAAEIRVLLQSLTQMRMLCNAHAQHAWQAVAARLSDPAPPSATEVKQLGSPKLEEFARVLVDLLDDSNRKIVVFSQWERMLRLAHFVVRDLLAQRDLRAAVFYGGLSGKARGAMLEAFRGDPELRVLFSTDAGGLGLNLQHSASIVVHLEVPWNPAVLEQRIGRVHRIGQRRSVQVLHFVTRDAIEERVRQVVADKRALFEGLLVDEADRVEFEDEERSLFVRRLQTVFRDGEAPAAG